MTITWICWPILLLIIGTGCAIVALACARAADRADRDIGAK